MLMSVKENDSLNMSWVYKVAGWRVHTLSKNNHLTKLHYDDVMMGAIVSQITSFTIVYSTVYSDADQRKHQSSASLAFVRGIHRGPENISIWWRHHDKDNLANMAL